MLRICSELPGASRPNNFQSAQRLKDERKSSTGLLILGGWRDSTDGWTSGWRSTLEYYGHNSHHVATISYESCRVIWLFRPETRVLEASKSQNLRIIISYLIVLIAIPILPD